MPQILEDKILEEIVRNPDSFVDETMKDWLSELVRRSERPNIRSGIRHLVDKLQQRLELQGCGFFVNSDLNVHVEYDQGLDRVCYAQQTVVEEVEAPTLLQKKGYERLVCPLYYRDRPAFGHAFFEKKQFTPKDAATIVSLIKRFSSGLNLALDMNYWKKMALEDGLTGAYRREMIELNYTQRIEDSQRKGEPISVILIDVDKFKEINDTYGHSYGDHVLKTVVDTAKQVVRPEDLVVRWGGDEFVVILLNTPNQKAKEIAGRIDKAVASTDFTKMSKLAGSKDANKEYYLGRTAGNVTVSVGVDWRDSADGKTHGSNILQAICDGADRDMYKEKKSRYISSVFPALSRTEKLFEGLVLMWSRKNNNMAVLAYNAQNLDETIEQLGEGRAYSLFADYTNQLQPELEGADLITREDNTDKIFSVHTSTGALDEFVQSMEELGKRTLEKLHSYSSSVAPDNRMYFSLGIAVFNRKNVGKKRRAQLTQHPQEVRSIARNLTEDAAKENGMAVRIYSTY